MLIKIGRRFEVDINSRGVFVALPWAHGARWEAFWDRTGAGLSAMSFGLYGASTAFHGAAE